MVLKILKGENVFLSVLEKERYHPASIISARKILTTSGCITIPSSMEVRITCTDAITAITDGVKTLLNLKRTRVNIQCQKIQSRKLPS